MEHKVQWDNTRSDSGASASPGGGVFHALLQHCGSWAVLWIMSLGESLVGYGQT